MKYRALPGHRSQRPTLQQSRVRGPAAEHRPGAADAVAHRLVAQMAGPFLLPGGTSRVGVCCGVACAERGGQAEQLLGAADAAMYVAKQAGKGRVALAGSAA